MFNADSFSLLKYNVFKNPQSKSILSEFPELVKNMPSFIKAVKREDCDKLIRFIVAMYDSKSPFIRSFQNVDQRKLECAAFAGYDLEGKGKEKLDAIFNMTDLDVVEMTIEFLRDQNSRIWTMIVSNEQTFYEYQKALLSEVITFNTDKDKLSAISTKSKLMEDSDIISSRLEKYYQMLYGGDEKLMKVAVNYTPEGLARQK